MSIKKNTGTIKKQETTPSRKINVLFPVSDSLRASDGLSQFIDLKLPDIQTFVLNDQGLYRVQKSDVPVSALNLISAGINELDKNGLFILANIKDQAIVQDINSWSAIKNLTTTTCPKKLIYATSVLTSEVSHSTLLVNNDFVKEIAQIIAQGVTIKDILPSLFSTEQQVMLEPGTGKKTDDQTIAQSVQLFFKEVFDSTRNGIQQLKSWPATQNSVVIEHPAWKLFLSGLLALALVYLIIGAIHVGIGGDEFKYINQASKVEKFYTSWGSDTTAYTKVGIDPQHFNGQLFDNVVYILGKPFGLEYNFTYRHIMTAGMAWLCIITTACTVLCLFNYRVAFITTLFMLLTPIFIGNGFNNHRDIPLAAGIIICMYAITRLGSIYPLLNKKYLIYLIAGMVISFGQRIAGGIMAGFLMAIYALMIILEKKDFGNLLKGNRLVWRWPGALLGAVFIGIVLAFLTWPYGLVSPWKHAHEVFTQSANLSVALYQTFESKYNLSSHMPNYYVFKYIGITIPAALLIGLILFLMAFVTGKLNLNRKTALFILFAILFPITYSYFKIGNFYGSWRHFMFTFPFMAIGAAAGWNAILSRIPQLRNIYLTLTVLGLLLIHPIRYVLRNHPFEYLYYNEFMGGTAGAYGKYEWDYSLNSIKQGSDWLKNYIRSHHPKGTKLLIATNGAQEINEYFKGFDDSVSTTYTRYYERSTQPWDYAIFPNMYIHPFQLQHDYLPKADSLHYIMIDGKPVCFILKRSSKLDYEAVQALARSDQNTALQKFSTYLKIYPHSEWAWFQQGYIFAQNGNWAQAQYSVTECFKHHPEFLPARALQGLIYINTNNSKAAQPIFDKLIYEKYDLANSYKWSAMTYENEGNFRKALTQYGFSLGAGNKEKATYRSIANCFRKLGDAGSAQKYDAMAN